MDPTRKGSTRLTNSAGRAIARPAPSRRGVYGALFGRWGACAIACFAACAAPAPRASELAVPRGVSSSSHASHGDPAALIFDTNTLDWAAFTSSPSWSTDEPVRLPTCVAYEQPLIRAAEVVAAAQARGVAAAEAAAVADVKPLLRALGSPHVWPRIWSMEGRALDPEQVSLEWSSWVARQPGEGQRRCGVARITGADDREIVVAVVVDVLADLDPLPLRARTGQWLRLEARLLAEARSGQLLLLGPVGAPRSVPSTLAGSLLRASFSLDQQGPWRLQVLIDAGVGPRPVLEAWIFVDEEPSFDAAVPAAPGERAELSASAGVPALRAALFSLIEAARRANGVLPLRRNQKLDELAQAHAQAMWQSGRTAHDVGDGLPTERLARAGLTARRVGENVARARSVERAHQALWDSPSHRGNLLDAGFTQVGIGIARADAHDVWVCELFADDAGVVTRRASTRGLASRSSSSELVGAPE